MKPFVKYGLIVGAVALFVIVPIAALMGICGPGVTLIAGAFAGFFTAYFGKTFTRREGAQSGAMAGAIAGGMTLIGQLLGGTMALAFFQLTRPKLSFGRIPGPNSPAGEFILYYASGLGTGLCFGLVGILLGAVAGAVAGHFGTRELPPPIVSVNTLQSQ